MLHVLLDRLRRDKDQQTCACIPDSRPSQEREARPERSRRDGAPTVLVMTASSKAGPPAPAGPIVLHAKVCGRVGRRGHKIKGHSVEIWMAFFFSSLSLAPAGSGNQEAVDVAIGCVVASHQIALRIDTVDFGAG